MLQTQQVLCDRYQLKQKLGESAGRQTWQAKDLLTQDKVVVKLLAFSDQIQWEQVRLFEREAQVLKQLRHPQIPKYRHHFTIDEEILWFGLVQQYIPGTSLKELLTQGRVCSESEARQLAIEILKILIYLHGLSPPVLHRDIKPSNLLLGEDAKIYLVDFGAVQDRAAREGATFTVVGTYGYAPLEQFGGRATPASDLYALGATLIHLLTGIPPADLPHPDSRIQFAHLVRLNPGFVRWLSQLTQPNQQQRFPSAREALQVLEENQNAISAAIAHPPPSESWIRVKKSPSRLQIQIPVLWSRVLTNRENTTVLLVVGFWWYLLSNFSGWYIFMWWVAGLILASWFIIPTLMETNVYLNHQLFEIEVKLLGVCLKRERGNVLEIDKVFQTDAAGYGKDKVPEVTFAVGVQEFSFSRLKPPLSKEECNWLIEEINHWLGL